MAHDYVDRFAIEAQAAREWDNDAKLRDEFRGRREHWIAYAMHEASGDIKIHRGTVVRGEDVRAEIARSASSAASGGLKVGGAAQVRCTQAAAGSGPDIAATPKRSRQPLLLFDASRYRAGGDLYIAATRRAYGY